MTGAVSVMGGTHSIVAGCDSMTALAGAVGKVAGNVAILGARLHRTLLSAELDRATMLDPLGSLRFGADLMSGLDGPAGLLATAAQLGLLHQDLLLAVAAYRSADALSTGAESTVEAIARLPVTAMSFQADVLYSTLGWATGHNADGSLPASLLGPLQRALARDPDLLDLAIRTGGSSELLALLRGGFTMNQLLADGSASVTRQSSSTVRGAANTTKPTGAPRNLRDIISGLDQRTTGGDIDVRFFESGSADPNNGGATGAGPTSRGPRAVIVDIPGTDSWTPSQGNTDVCNLGTNLLAIEGRPTTYQRGVVQAMRDAGVRPDDQVMLVGHSQGGMVAMNTARDLSRSGEFNVTHVVTAGSPIAALAAQLPGHVQVLAIENSRDIVPHLDGAPNPDRSNITTVTVHHGYDTVEENHSLETAYVPGAADIDAARLKDRSLDDFLRSASAFTSADSVQTQVFHISRKPG